MPDRPRVGIDATALGPGGKGIARYLADLLPEVAALAPDAAVQPVVLAGPDARLPAGIDGIAVVAVRSRPAIRWEQVELPRVARRERLALVHVTTDRLPVLPAPPLALYLFEDPRHRLDLARGSRTPKVAVADALTTALFPLSIRRARVLLTSAESTARDLVARGIDRGRIGVIRPGVSESFRPGSPDEIAAVRASLDLAAGYVLHFSSSDARDNTPVAIEAYAKARALVPALPPLVIAGRVGTALARQQELVAALALAPHVRWLGYIPDEQLAGVYQAATAYLDPSLFEGFGYQVAEAMLSGVPVVCSASTSLPEVVGDAGLLAAPTDRDGFAAALARLVTEPGLAAELGRRGAARRELFGWRRCAEETVAAWERACIGSAR